MRFKYGLKTQKLLAQGVWGKTYESSIKKRYKTPRNADKHRGFGAFGEE